MLIYTSWVASVLCVCSTFNAREGSKQKQKQNTEDTVGKTYRLDRHIFEYSPDFEPMFQALHRTILANLYYYKNYALKKFQNLLCSKKLTYRLDQITLELKCLARFTKYSYRRAQCARSLILLDKWGVTILIRSMDS